MTIAGAWIERALLSAERTRSAEGHHGCSGFIHSGWFEMLD